VERLEAILVANFLDAILIYLADVSRWRGGEDSDCAS
jgi:hypothetical protein